VKIASVLALVSVLIAGCSMTTSAPIPPTGSCINDPVENGDGVLIDYDAVTCGAGPGLKVLHVYSGTGGPCPSGTTDSLHVSEQSGPLIKMTTICTSPE
jgi:hypothetical protein